MRLFAAALAAASTLAGCGGEKAPEGVEVEEAWVRLPPVPGRPGAAYFTLEAPPGPATLEAVESPQAERIELHETREEGGVSRMKALASLPFPADRRLEFAPGGRHAMLLGLDPALKPGGTIPLTFHFRGAEPVTVEAQVRGAADGPPEHDGH